MKLLRLPLSLLCLLTMAFAQRWAGESFSVAPAGGSFNLNDGAVQFTFPLNAVAGTTKITVIPNSLYPDVPLIVPDTAYSITPAGATFGANVQLTISYNQAALPTGASEANLRMYSINNHRWVLLASSVDTVANTVTTATKLTGTFAIIASTNGSFIGENLLTARIDGSESGMQGSIANFYRVAPFVNPGSSYGYMEPILPVTPVPPGATLNGSENAFYFLRTQLGGKSDLYICNIDGSNVQRVTSRNTTFQGYTTSADGRYILYVSGGALHRATAYGVAPAQLAASNVTSCAYAPSGSAVAYSLANGNIQIVTLAGALLTSIATGLAGVHDITFNRAGSQIAFSALFGGGNHIHTVASSGGAVKRQTDGGEDHAPLYDPSGTAIAYLRASGATGIFRVATTDPVDSQGTLVLYGPTKSRFYFLWR